MFYYYLSGNNGEFLIKGFVYTASELSQILKDEENQYRYDFNSFGEFIYNNVNELHHDDTIIFQNMTLEIF